MLLNILFSVLGAILVLVGADKLTDGAVGLARRFRISEMVIGLTIVAFGTSLPEFIVSLIASIQGSAPMSIGNIVGSNLFNTLMIVGCTAIVSPIVVSRSTVYKDVPFSILASVVLITLALDSVLSRGSSDMLTRGDGIILLCFFAVFMAYTMSIARPDSASDATSDSEQMPVWRMLLYIVFGMAGLIAGGELFVDGASGIARQLGVSEAVIGLTLVAGGTSLPELATSVVAARKGKSDIAIGNVVGSNLFNVFWILGFCATVSPMPVSGITWMDFTMLLFASLLFWLFARTKHNIQSWEGVVMVISFAAYITWLIIGL